MKVLNPLLRDAPEMPSRYGNTKELVQVSIACKDPLDRLIHYKSRKENIIAQIAEVLWVIGGSDEIFYLTPFLPRAPEFSDDGETWRAAYGKRLRDYRGKVDQLKTIIEILKQDLYSRRAFMVISDPEIDLNPGKDITCNTFISYLVRKEDGIDKLFMSVTNRSNDFVWGYTSVNYIEFTMLQEFIANQLGVKPGTYVHNSVSFHVYEPHWDKLDKMIEEDLQIHPEKYCPKFSFSSLETFDSIFVHYKHAIERITNKENSIEVWEDFKTLLYDEPKFQESLIYFEIPILWLLLEDPEFVGYIKSYIRDNYLNKTSLFYEKVNSKFLKRSNNQLIE